MKKSIFKKIGGLFLGLAMGLGVVTGVATKSKTNEVRADSTYHFANIPTKGWSTSGSTVTINGIEWTYSSSTYISGGTSGIQIGSSNKPQTSNWTISCPLSSFVSGQNVVKSVAITARTTATSGTYDISVNGNSKISGNLSTTSNAFTASDLSEKSGNIVITLKGNANCKAMYLTDIAVVFGESTSSAKLTEIYAVQGKRSYYVNEVFVPDVIMGKYDDNSEAEVEATFSSPDMTTAGQKTINVSYTEGGITKNTFYTISVEEREQQLFNKFESDPVEGKFVIIGNGLAVKATVSSDRLEYTGPTIVDDVIDTPDLELVWVFTANGDYWNIFNETNNVYLASTGAKNKASLSDDPDDNKSLWTITHSGDSYEIVNKANSEGGVNCNLRYNTGYGFACYGTGTGLSLNLYKLEEAQTFSVTYLSTDSDSGTAPEDTNEYSSGDPVTVLGNTGNLYRDGYEFDGWTDGVKTYYADDTFEIFSNVSLQPHWLSLSTSVEIKTTALSGYDTQTATLTADCNNFTANSYAWSSNSDSLVLSSTSGSSVTVTFTGDSEVTGQISLTASNETVTETDSIELTVIASSHEIVLNPANEEINLKIGTSYEITPTVTLSGKYSSNAITISSNDSKVTVSSTSVTSGTKVTISASLDAIVDNIATITFADAYSAFKTLCVTITGAEKGETEANPFAVADVLNYASTHGITSGKNTDTNFYVKAYVLCASVNTYGGLDCVLADEYRDDCKNTGDINKDTEIQGYSIICNEYTNVKKGDIIVAKGIIINFNNTIEIGFKNITGHDEKICSVNVLNNITVSGTPTQSSQYEGKALNTSGLSFNLSHAQETDLKTSIDSSKINWSTTVAGQSPSGIYANKEILVSSITIVADTIKSIRLAGALNKTDYKTTDESFDLTGLYVEAEWNSNPGDYSKLTDSTKYTISVTNGSMSVETKQITVKAVLNNTSIEDSKNFDVNIIKSFDPSKLTYSLVTDASDLSVGDYIVIVAKDYNAALSTEQRTANRGQTEITKNTVDNTNTINNPTDIQYFELKKGIVDSSFSFYTTNNTYIYASSSGSNELKSQTNNDGNSSWKITITDGTASIIAQGSNTRKYLQYNASSSIFACYSSASQKAVSIYKGHSYECVIGDMNYTSEFVEGSKGTATAKVFDQYEKSFNCPVSFASSDSSILKIDSTTGSWEALKAGTVKVTATSTKLSGDGKTYASDEIEVTVIPATVEMIELFGIHETQYLYDIGKCSFFAMNQNTDQCSPEVEYSSDNTSVITIDSETGNWRAVKSGTATITVASKVASSEGTFESDSITVTVSTAKPDHGYVIVSNADDLYDGDIVLIGAKGANKIVSGKTETTLTNGDAEFIQMTSGGSYMAVANSYTEFTVRKSGSNFGFVTSNGSMIADNSNNIKFQEEESLNWTVSISSGTATLKYDGSSNSLRCNSASDQMKLYSSGTTIQLYKKSVGSAMQIAQKYNSYIDSACDTEGIETNTEKLQNAWKVTSVAFKMMPTEEKIALLEGENETFANMLSSYEYIYEKYGNDLGLEDFLSIGLSSDSRTNPITNLSNVDNSVWVISAVALIGLTAIGGYFFYRKRKEI